ncbi:MAG: hypothetical protein AAF598_03035 [Bacteroidota bacterium]
MKANLLSLLFLFISLAGFSQGVGINTTTPDPSAVLDVQSTDKGVLVPRMNSTQRLGINGGNPAEGLMVFDTQTNSFWFYTGSTWQEFGADTDWIEDFSRVRTDKGVSVGTNLNSVARIHSETPIGAQNWMRWTQGYTGLTSTEGLYLGLDSGENTQLFSYEPGDLFFGTNGAFKAIITADDRFGFGTTGPNRAFEFSGTGTKQMRLNSTTGSPVSIELMRQGSTRDWSITNNGNFLDFSVSDDDFSTSSFQLTLTNTGRLGVGNSSPQQELHVNGTVRSSDLTGSGTRNVVANSFGDLIVEPNISKQYTLSGYDFNSNSTSFNYSSIAYNSSGSLALVAPVHLPDGATVTSMEATVGDISSTTNLNVRLVRLTNATGASQNVASVTSSGSPGNVLTYTDSTISLGTIDYDNYAYLIFVTPTASWDFNRVNIRNIQINYTE